MMAQGGGGNAQPGLQVPGGRAFLRPLYHGAEDAQAHGMAEGGQLRGAVLELPGHGILQGLILEFSK